MVSLFGLFSLQHYKHFKGLLLYKPVCVLSLISLCFDPSV